MVIYNTPTRLAGCGLCGADEVEVAPIFPRDEDEYGVAANPNAIPEIPKAYTSVDKAAAALKPFPSWAIGVGIGVVALGVVGAVWAVSKRA